MHMQMKRFEKKKVADLRNKRDDFVLFLNKSNEASSKEGLVLRCQGPKMWV